VTCTSLIGLNSTRLNMNLLLRISNATTTKMMTDVACDFIEPSGEDTLEYDSQQQIHVQTGGIQADQRSTSHDTTKNFGKLTNKFIKLI
jgi:hypothetical protein